MKKTLLTFFIAILLISALVMAVGAVTLYAPDGRSIEVEQQDVAAWENVGWHPMYSGTCGAQATWTLYNGTLTISGSGALDSDTFKAFSYNMHSKVISIVINEGITSLDSFMFLSNYDNCKQLSLPKSLESIRLGALDGLKLDGIYLYENAKCDIGFGVDITVKNIYYYGCNWSSSAWSKCDQFKNSQLYYMMYADNGIRSAPIVWNEANLYHDWGWKYYDETFQSLYAIDGRSTVVPKSEVPTYVALGWYENVEDVWQTLYAPNLYVSSYSSYYTGYKAVTVLKNQADSYLSVGWYRTMQEVTNFYLNSGNDYYSVLKKLTGSTSQVKQSDIDTEKNRIIAALRNSNKCPLFVSGYWMSENSIGVPTVNIKFINIGTKTIRGFDLSFDCYDIYGKATSDWSHLSNRFNGYCNDEWDAPGDTFELTWTLNSHEQTTSVKNITIKKIAFSDGTQWGK